MSVVASEGCAYMDFGDRLLLWGKLVVRF